MGFSSPWLLLAGGIWVLGTLLYSKVEGQPYSSKFYLSVLPHPRHIYLFNILALACSVPEGMLTGSWVSMSCFRITNHPMKTAILSLRKASIGAIFQPIY